MSRGGRGGGNRGGLKGATWDTTHDYEGLIETGPRPDYPEHPHLKRPAPLTDTELRQFKHYKALHTDIHRGPLYTQSTKRNAENPAKTFNEDQFNRQYGTNPKADLDPFTAVETYSMRYIPKKNVIPKLSGRPFNKELFPKELWPTLEGEEGEKVRKSINGAMQKKAAMMGIKVDKTKALEEILATIGDDVEEDLENEDPNEEDIDDDFEDQDEDMGGDYNAEQYFDNGDDGDDGDEGGGGGDDY